MRAKERQGWISTARFRMIYKVLFNNGFISFLPGIQRQRRHRQIDGGFTGSVMDVITWISLRA